GVGAPGQLPGRRRRARQQGHDQGRQDRPGRREHVGHRGGLEARRQDRRGGAAAGPIRNDRQPDAGFGAGGGRKQGRSTQGGARQRDQGVRGSPWPNSSSAGRSSRSSSRSS